MKYDLSSHTLYDEDNYYRASVVSLYIGTLEMIFDYDSGILIGVQGYLPLVKANRKDMSFPNYKDGKYQMPRYDELELKEYMAYEFGAVCKESAKYFTPLTISYDSANGIIMIGEINVSKEVAIRIKSDIYCYLDEMNNLKGLCLHLE